jgi:hypothetical protein
MPATRTFETFALIPIDASERRHSERLAYLHALKVVERAARRLKAFETLDLPAHDRWFEAEFLQELTELRAVTAKVRELQALVMAVCELAGRMRITRGEAYAAIMAAREAGTFEDLWKDRDEEDEDEAEEREQRHQDSGEHQRRSREDRTSSGATGSDRRAATVNHYLKTLYRNLVRLLHPDTNPDASPEAKARWQEVQDAYAAQDLSRLERLYRAIAKTAEAVLDLATAPIGDIIALRQAAEARFSALRAKLREARGHPAWSFRTVQENPQRLARLRRKFEDELTRDLAQMARQERDMESLLTLWSEDLDESSARRRRRADRGRRRAPVRDLWEEYGEP